MPVNHSNVTSPDAPPSAANVATAYPPSEMHGPALSKILAIVTLFGAAVVLFVHYVDHPTTQALKSRLKDAVSSPDRSSLAEDVNGLPTSNRLAVCFSGDVGSLASVLDQNLKAIRQVDSSAAIFFNLNLHDDYYNERTGEHFTTVHRLESLRPVFHAAKAVKVNTFTPSDVSDLPRSNCHKKEGTTKEHYSHNHIQFYGAARCYEMIQAEEKAKGKRFGWILRLQPNMNILVRMPPEDVHPRVHMSGSAIALMPRQLADAYFSVVDAFSQGRCTQLDDMGDEPCKKYSYSSDSTECLIIKWLKTADIVPSNGVYVNRRIVYPDVANER